MLTDQFLCRKLFLFDGFVFYGNERFSSSLMCWCFEAQTDAYVGASMEAQADAYGGTSRHRPMHMLRRILETKCFKHLPELRIVLHRFAFITPRMALSSVEGGIIFPIPKTIIKNWA